MREFYLGIATSLALTAIAAVVAYFSLSVGFELYDTAITSVELFQGGALIFMGVVFAIDAVGNLVASYLRATSENFSLKNQILISIGGPILAIPVAVAVGCLVVIIAGSKGDCKGANCNCNCTPADLRCCENTCNPCCQTASRPASKIPPTPPEPDEEP